MSPGTGPSSISPAEGAPISDSGPKHLNWRRSGIPGWRTLVSIASALAYPLLVYWVLVQRHPWFGLPLTLTALLGLCMCLPRRGAKMGAVVGTLALAAVVVAFASPTFLLFLPPVCVNLGLAWFFGRTLAPGREALITRLARLKHRQPDPRMLTYTRRLTWVWVVFFLIMAAVSGALAASGAREAWVWFTAAGNYLCVGALFAIEYGYRRWRFPRNDHVSPMQQILMIRAAFGNRRR
jgi:uncharacterized membrane protein